MILIKLLSTLIKVLLDLNNLVFLYILLKIKHIKNPLPINRVKGFECLNIRSP